jgi:hypothetical protein
MPLNLGPSAVSLKLGSQAVNAYIGAELLLTGWSPASLLLNFNGADESTTFTDSSANEFSVTRTGSVEISTDESKYGGASGVFPGSGAFLETEADAELDLSTNGDITLEAWIYPVAFDGFNNGIVGSHASTSDAHTNVTVYDDGRVSVGRIGLNEIATDAGVVETGDWYHVAVVRSGSTTKIYVDGVEEASATTAVWSSPATTTIRVGHMAAGNGSTFNGYIDDLRLTRRAVYTANFTPPVAQLGPNA